VALHILTLVLSVALPMLLNHRPLLDNVVTVNLVSLPDTGQEVQQPAAAPPVEQAAPPEPAPEPEPVPKLEPVKPKVEVPVPEPMETPKPVVAKAVSLKPVKKKKKLVDEEKLVQEKTEQQRLKEIAKARLEEQTAQREAEKARAALADMIKARGEKPSASSAKGTSARQGVQSIVSQQYLMTVGARMQQFWILPEMRQWDPKLEAVVVLIILRDGTVAKVTVEQQSADRYFDEFVMKTIESASPMPPFPNLMGENSIEVGFRFRPNEEVSL
jgi:colicin import membrane protein